jgi:hypothetical protein
MSGKARLNIDSATRLTIAANATELETELTIAKQQLTEKEERTSYC